MTSYTQRLRITLGLSVLFLIVTTQLSAQVPAVVTEAVDRTVTAIGIESIERPDSTSLLADAITALAQGGVDIASDASERELDRLVRENAAVPLIRWMESIGVDSFGEMENAAALYEFVALQVAGDLARNGYHVPAAALRRRRSDLHELQILRRWANAVDAGREVAILGNSISLLGMARSGTGGDRNGDAGNATLIVRQPAGTEVLVNGRLRGAVPTEIEVPVGDVDVAFRSETAVFPGQIVSVQAEDRLLLQPSGDPAGTTRVSDGLSAGRIIVLERSNGTWEVLHRQRTATLAVGEYQGRVVSIGRSLSSRSLGTVSISEGVVTPISLDDDDSARELVIEGSAETLDFTQDGHTAEELADGRRVVRLNEDTSDALVVTLPVGSERAEVVVPVNSAAEDSSVVDLSLIEIEIGPLPAFSTFRVAGTEIASVDVEGDNLTITESADGSTWSATVALPRGTYQVALRGPTHEPQRLTARPRGSGTTIAIEPDLRPRPALEVGLSLSDRRAVLPNTEYYVRLTEVGASEDGEEQDASAEWSGAVGAGFSPLVTSLPGEEIHLVVGLTGDPEPVFDEQIQVEAGELRVVPVELAFSNRYLLTQLEDRRDEVAEELEAPLARREKQIRRTRIWGGIAAGLAVLTGIFYFNGLGHRNDYDSADTTADRADAYDSLQQARLWSLVGSAATFGAGTVAVTNWASRPDIEDLERRYDALDAEIARIQEEM